jgi:hypothetical protein
VNLSASQVHTLLVDHCPKLHTLLLDNCAKLQHAQVNAPELVVFEKALCPFESLVLNTPLLHALSFEVWNVREKKKSVCVCLCLYKRECVYMWWESVYM